jgi:putative RecB family exonuclease
MSCPLLYRYRVIDKLPERPSIDAVRGTVVHKVLEHLFDLPAPERNHEQAAKLIGPAWSELSESEPELTQMFGPDTTDLATWLDQCRELLAQYFQLEDPTRLEPAEREVHVETQLDSGLTLHGYIDRVDIAPTGAIRIVDYKSGRSPGELFEAKALFQMKFYALVIWRTRSVIPALLQLIYLGNGEVLRYEPDEQSLLATERKVAALWEAIERATRTGQWLPRKSALCGWCDHQAICPAWGGTPPPLPESTVGGTPRPLPENSGSVQVAGDLDFTARPQSRILSIAEGDRHSLVRRLHGVEPSPGGVV